MKHADTLTWTECRFRELTPMQVYLLIKLRIDVFVVEQQCVYTELDGRDLESNTVHVFATADDKPLAYARILMPHDIDQTNSLATPESIYIGRVVVVEERRRQGLARALMQRVLQHCEHHYPTAVQALSAQVQVQDFYTSLGFTSCGEEYLEDGIAHIDMRRQSSAGK